MDKLRAKAEYFLRKTEPIFKTDMIYLARGGFWLGANQFVASLATFLLAIAYAHLLPKEVYGTYKYILSVSGILVAFTLTGMNTALIRAVAQGFEGALHNAFWTKLRWSILMVCLALSGSIYYALNGNSLLSGSLAVVALFLPITQSVILYSPYLNGKKEFGAQSRYGMISNIGVSLLLFVSIILSKNAFTLVFAYFAGTAVITLFLYLHTIKKFPPNNAVDTGAIQYGKHLSFMSVLNSISGNLDSFLMWHFLGPTPLAVYSFALAIPSQVNDLLGNILTLAFPKLSQRPLDELKHTLPYRMFILFVVVVCITVLYVLCAPFIYKIFFPEYVDSIHYSQLLALTFFALPTGLIHTAVTAHAHKKKLYFLSTAAPVIRITLLVTLLPLYGISGAVASIVGSQLAISVILLFIFYKMF